VAVTIGPVTTALNSSGLRFVMVLPQILTGGRGPCRDVARSTGSPASAAAVGVTQDSTRSSAGLLLLDPVPVSGSSHCEHDQTGEQADYPTDNGGRNSQLEYSEPGSRRVHEETNRQPGDAASSSCAYGADDKKPRENRKPHHGCDCAHGRSIAPSAAQPAGQGARAWLGRRRWLGGTVWGWARFAASVPGGNLSYPRAGDDLGPW
jgi:hypothetical protein